VVSNAIIDKLSLRASFYRVLWRLKDPVGGRIRGPVSIGIRNWISSFEMTLSGSYGIKPAPAKPPYMFFFRNRGKEYLPEHVEKLCVVYA
jgi:hypothetical protein